MKTFYQEQLGLLKSQEEIARQGFMAKTRTLLDKMYESVHANDCNLVFKQIEELALLREALAGMTDNIKSSIEYYKGLIPGERTENA